ncbi:hydroxymethylbilane synthase [Clostridium folliculivorans]|uniref:Porphobilinogen deaminase n=1 Tax=Clostridium folliculivorans TaxID=2886038 RepID=A0A9W5Y342_9CLOT|nr:hydroxymethylbilane synthase [Clostridium folliculivorans]GKU25673.1 porphobilinogen deaminase [Clostridium folliculivorans]GKU28695.1 porphobilinogen deaminase [Clostridium folliculivorans]
MSLIIATRKSKLAQTQTEIVMELLRDKCSIESEKILMSTEGDRRLDVALNKIGGKGLFVKEIEYALLEGKADAAVHSMKDVPFALEEPFEIVAMPEREDPRDAFISMKNISFYELKKGARIGTSSIRRSSQLRVLRPDIEIVPIRGNVQTRLDKIEKENLDGIILAAAGLRRLDMEDIITDYFNEEVFLPAVGQGALGIETLKTSDKKHIFSKLDDAKTRITVEAERSFMKELNGGCHSPIGAYAKIENKDIYILGIYEINDRLVKKDIQGKVEEHIKLGKDLAKKIIKEL